MWDTFEPKDGVWYGWRLHGAAAYARKHGDAWEIAWKSLPLGEITADFGGPEIAAPPAPLPVIRIWAGGTGLSLVPALGPKPYLLTVREKARIAPGLEARFTAALPPELRFKAQPETVLGEAMPFTLPQTWLGEDTMGGEFGYSLRGGLLPQGVQDPRLPGAFIRCDIRIKNSSRSVFDLEQFALSPESLNIYACQNQLVADTLELEFSGTDQKTAIIPAKGDACRLISPGVRSSVGETIARRSVDIIKNITRF
jgi:hypothetical protein